MKAQHGRRLDTAIVVAFAIAIMPAIANAQTDPGPRGGAPGAGARLAGLTVKEAKFFDTGLDEFQEIASVDGAAEDTEEGLGPRFNMTGCATCHAHPAVGGTSPLFNPQVDPKVNPVPSHQITLVTQTVPILVPVGPLSATGPVREVRFSHVNGQPDGGVHQLFTIAGLPGTPAGCTISQPAFEAARDAGTLRFRIPTPVFGLGLIEAIEDATILLNENPSALKTLFGISGNANRNGNDGTVTRFGWKAQNKSLVIFAGEAYNVEQGITNELFPDERGEGGRPDSASCRQVVTAPQDFVHYDVTQPQQVIDNVNAFANFMRFLEAPAQVTSYTGVTSAQITAGEAAFDKAGCSVCHVKSMQTGNHDSAALRNKTVRLFSDLLLHDIGTGDQIAQGGATGEQFRSAPLWGAGQRIFFMHDGHTEDLVEAINDHRGEATKVIDNFNGAGGDAAHKLDATERQNLIYFLRSL